MESLVEQLNYYSKHGIPQLQQQQIEDDNDEGNDCSATFLAII
jgi:hypothetical protein